MDFVRPIYEDDGDRANEQRLKSLLEKKWDVHLTKIPKSYHADFFASRKGKIVSFVEIKVRSISIKKYDSYMISLMKIVGILNYTERINIPCFLFIQWSDAMGYIKITNEIIKDVRMQSVNFRNDPNDLEPCVHIPISDFKPFNP